MSLLKIKIVFEDEIRMFKTKSDEKELLNGIISFVKESYNIERFRLVFKDEEDDEITITDNDDLQEALNNNNNKKIAKLYVKNTQNNKDEEEKESEEDTRGDTTSEEETDDTSSNDTNDSCKWLKLLDDISQDKELKDEFISFLTTFVLSFQNEKENNNNNEGNLNNGSELFIKALSLYPKLDKHETISLFVSEKLNSLFYQSPHLLQILKQINVKDIPKFINIFIDLKNNYNNKSSPTSNHCPRLPPFLFPFLGLFNDKFQCNNNNNYERRISYVPTIVAFNNHKGHHGRHHHRGRHGWCHGRKFFGGMNNEHNNDFEKCRKDKDLLADIINENITLGRNAFVNSNETLIKTWKLKNVGRKAIPSNCSIEYFGKRFNLMIDGSKFELKNKKIEINEEFEVSVVVKAPNNNGKYKSKWKLVTPNGNKFGKPLIVSFIVNDNNNNYNSNSNKQALKQLKKLMKQEQSHFKKQSKLLRKEDKMNKREEKLEFKKEKLRNKREKLLKKLEELEQQTNTLNQDNNNINNDDKDDVKEEVVVEENVDNSNNNYIVNDVDDEEEEEDVVIDDDKVTLEGDDKFIYNIQLEQLKSMGFRDENKLKQLLEINDGSVQAVLNNIM